MTYDCFTFFNELDLLEIRLNVLNEVVDKFVLVEMVKTFSGKDKPLYFQANKHRFAKFEKKIIHIIVEDVPQTDDCWVLESHQRNCITRGLEQCRPDDKILISDLDEIPNPAIIPKLDCSKDIWLLEQKMYYYFVNYLDVGNSIWGHGTKVLSYHNLLHGLNDVEVPYSVYLPKLANHGTTPNKLRMWTGAHVVSDGGWHFSYLGGIDAIVKKIQSFSHQEYNKPQYTDKRHLLRKISRGEDIFDRKGHSYRAVCLDESFPRYLQDNQGKYRHLIFPITVPYRLRNCLKQTIACVAYFFYHKNKKVNGRCRIYVLGIKVFSYNCDRGGRCRCPDGVN